MASSSELGTVAARISAFQNRPATSVGSEREPARAYPRKQRSLGNLISQLDGTNELQEARARLKHVEDVKKSPKKEETKKPAPQPPAAIRRRRTNSSVLEELDDLLDTAIGENTNQFTTTDSRETTDDHTLDWPLPRPQSFTSKSPSKYASRHSGIAAKRRQSRQRHLRTNSSGVVESNSSVHNRGPSIDSNRPRSSTDTEAADYRALPSEIERKPIRIAIPNQLQSGKSPIKQRTALFEKLSQHEAVVVHEVPHTHDARNPIKIKGIWPPKKDEKGENKARNEFFQSLEKHHMDFHHGRDEMLIKNNPDSPPRSSSPEKPRATHVPPIPLTLPQLLTPRRQSRTEIASSSNSFTTAPQRKDSSASVPGVSTTKQEEPKGERSYNWPLKWDIFRKPPNASIKESGFVARAEPDHHTSAKKTHENQHRVHDLLVGAQNAVKESSSEPEGDQQKERQSTPPSTSMPGALADTPRGSSAAEKEVASQSSVTPARTITPSTPRGRPRLQDLEVITHSPAVEKESNYRVEQRFALSRSRSRGGGVRVQVEIRSPRGSPERADHTVIVTANVEAIEGEVDGLYGSD